jgi:hypothetical protein
MANCPADFLLTGGDYDFLLRNLLRHLSDGASLEPGIWRTAAPMASRATAAPSPRATTCDLPRIDRDLTQLAQLQRPQRQLPPHARRLHHGRARLLARPVHLLLVDHPLPELPRPHPRVGRGRDRPTDRAHGVREVMDDTGCFPVGDWLRDLLPPDDRARLQPAHLLRLQHALRRPDGRGLPLMKPRGLPLRALRPRIGQPGHARPARQEPHGRGDPRGRPRRRRVPVSTCM